MNTEKEQKVLDVSFDVLLIFKSLFALGEVIAGIALFFLTPARLNALIARFTAGEIREDSHDLISNALINFGHHFTVGAQYLAAIYLLTHGLIKLITLFLLFRKIMWAYPISIVVFAGFIIYQMTEFFHNHHLTLLLVAALDLLMIILTILEFRSMRKARKKPA